MLNKWVSIFISIMFVTCTFRGSEAIGRKLVWADEFDYSGIVDSTKWSYVEGNGCPSLCGWGNAEMQHYTKHDLLNCKVENGYLHITTIKGEDSSDYTSAKIVSHTKGDWKYGKVEIRAKLPKGRGVWPAIWMMPSSDTYGGWPRSGEIDIMEHVGYEPDSVYATVHTLAYHHSIGTQKSRGIFVEDVSEQFHVYTMSWNDKAITMSIDGNNYYRFDKEEGDYKVWPFDQPFYLILNIAVGGHWGGKYGVDDSIFPQSMIVDYVRVYQ